MKMMRFWGELVVGVGVGVCSKAMRRDVCLMLEDSCPEFTDELDMEVSKLNSRAGKIEIERLSRVSSGNF